MSCGVSLWAGKSPSTNSKKSTKRFATGRTPGIGCQCAKGIRAPRHGPGIDTELEVVDVVTAINIQRLMSAAVTRPNAFGLGITASAPSVGVVHSGAARQRVFGTRVSAFGVNTVKLADYGLGVSVVAAVPNGGVKAGVPPRGRPV